MSEAEKFLQSIDKLFPKLAHYMPLGRPGKIVDVGGQEHSPIAGAIAVEPGHVGYNGYELPYTDLDAVFSSHTLEHMTHPLRAWRAWHAAVHDNGLLVVIVPHQYLYERKRHLPSRQNTDHKRFYTPGSLLTEIEHALAPNSYRVRYLSDDDTDYDYLRAPPHSPAGNFSIVVVLEKIHRPGWEME